MGSFSRQFARSTSKAQKQARRFGKGNKIFGLDAGDFLFGGEALQRRETRKFEQGKATDSPAAKRGTFERLTRLLEQSGGQIPSKIAETATSVRSAQGSTVAQSRRSGRFVIPRGQRKNLTSSGVGVNAPESRGLNIVI